MKTTRRRRYLGFWLLLAACSDEHKVPDKSDGGADAAGDVGDYDASAEFADCDESTTQFPDSLVCTGLYSSLLRQTIADDVREFTPAFPLWSDGAKKRRWILLPEGEKIDNSQPNDWFFPVGTKLWKEFSVNGKRIETRLFWKTRPDHWENTTYVWNDDDTEAISSIGGDIKLKDGSMYHLPTDLECKDCHRGQTDRVLGFSAVNLGLAGADGVTLKQLVKDGLLSDPPKLTELSIGADATGLDDDGVPLAAKVLGTLHTNCGQTCHNDNPDRKAKLSEQNLRLDSTILDGRAPDGQFNVLRTAVNQRAEGVQFDNHPYRILAGDPENSLIIQLMSYRDPTFMGRGQMPPIGTRKVDTESVKLITKWIRALGPAPQADAGTAMDAGVMDAGPLDAGPMDAGMDAATELDAGPPDAGQDAGSDAGSDAGEDAGADAGADAGVDAGSDAGPDLSDADTDAELDAGETVDPDAGEEPDTDAGPDGEEEDPDQ